MKTFIFGLALFMSFASHADYASMGSLEFNQNLRDYPNPQKLFGKYKGVVSKKFGANNDCFLVINNFDSTSVHFEATAEKGTFSKSLNRLVSIKGYKKHYLEQAQLGEIEVKRSIDLDYSYSLNYGYSLPHHDRTDFGTLRIQVNAENIPLEFIHSRGHGEEVYCENLERIN